MGMLSRTCFMWPHVILDLLWIRNSKHSHIGLCLSVITEMLINQTQHSSFHRDLTPFISLLLAWYINVAYINMNLQDELHIWNLISGMELKCLIQLTNERHEPIILEITIKPRMFIFASMRGKSNSVMRFLVYNFRFQTSSSMWVTSNSIFRIGILPLKEITQKDCAR